MAGIEAVRTMRGLPFGSLRLTGADLSYNKGSVPVMESTRSSVSGPTARAV
jgi:hypothetical protein